MIEPEEKSTTDHSDLLAAFDQVDEWLEEIQKQEDEAVDRIFLRFCLLKGKAIDFDQVRRKRFPANPNLWTYYYKYGTPEQYFLLTRELIVEMGDEGIKRHLRIVFNPELLKED